MNVWGITSGSAGMVAQVKALAAALGVKPDMKTADICVPFVYLPNIVYGSPLRHCIVPYLLAPGSDALDGPLPDMVISCGRRGALVAMGLRARHRKGHTRFIHIQDPQVSARYFDMVVAMEHDSITGPNVFKTRFALHAITPDTLASARRKFEPKFASCPKPYVAVLLGGSTNKYTLSAEAMARLIMSLQQFLRYFAGTLLITPSRRTGEDNIRMLQKTFAGKPNVYIYDFSGDNPYMGMLALAEAVIVTNDSVNMMSEALATGKPVYILPLPGHIDTKPSRFADRLVREHYARILGDRLEQWTYAVNDEMQRLAEKIKVMMK